MTLRPSLDLARLDSNKFAAAPPPSRAARTPMAHVHARVATPRRLRHASTPPRLPVLASVRPHPALSCASTHVENHKSIQIAENARLCAASARNISPLPPRTRASCASRRARRIGGVHIPRRPSHSPRFRRHAIFGRARKKLLLRSLSSKSWLSFNHFPILNLYANLTQL